MNTPSTKEDLTFSAVGWRETSLEKNKIRSANSPDAFVRDRIASSHLIRFLFSQRSLRDLLSVLIRCLLFPSLLCGGAIAVYSCGGENTNKMLEQCLGIDFVGVPKAYLFLTCVEFIFSLEVLLLNST